MINKTIGDLSGIFTPEPPSFYQTSPQKGAAQEPASFYTETHETGEHQSFYSERTRDGASDDLATPAHNSTNPFRNTEYMPQSAERSKTQQSYTQRPNQNSTLLSGTSTQMNRPHKIKKIAPTFSGKEEDNFFQFDHELRTYLEGSDLTPLQEAAHLPMWLTGLAKEYWYSLPVSTQRDMPEALKALKKEFMGEGYRERKAQELEQARMDPKRETPSQFCNRIKRILMITEPRKDMHEVLAKNAFLAGLPSAIRIMVGDRHERIEPLEIQKNTADRLVSMRKNAPIEGFSVPAFNELEGNKAKQEDQVDSNPKQPPPYDPQRAHGNQNQYRGPPPPRGGYQNRRPYNQMGNYGKNFNQRGTYRPRGIPPRNQQGQKDGCWTCGDPEHIQRFCPEEQAQRKKTDPDGQVPVQKLGQNRNF